MKKQAFAVMTMIAVLALLVGGCGTPVPTAAPTTPPPPEATTPPEATPTPEPVIGTTYKLGFFSSITGPTSSLGVPERNTAEMVAAQLEEAGGVVGPDGVIHPIEVIIYDDESNPEVAATVASRLIDEDEVDAIVGGSGSGPSLACVPLMQEAEIPYVSMASSRAIIMNPETGETYMWCFKTPQENLHSGGWQARYADAMGWDQVCDIYSNDGYGQDCLAQTTAAMATLHIEVSYSDSFEPADTEFPQIASVVASGCDALVIGAVPPGASLVTVAAREGAPDLPVVLGHGVCNATMISAAGEAAEGTVFPCGKLMYAEGLPDDDPQKELLVKYREDYMAFTGEGPEAVSTFGGHAYDGLLWVIEAMTSLDEGLDLTARRAAIRDYMETNITDWPGTGGVFNVTPEDHLGLTYEALGFVKVEDGTWVYYPPEEW